MEMDECGYDIRLGLDSLPSLSDSSLGETPFKGDCLTSFNPVTDEFVRKLITSSKPTTCDFDPIPTPLLVESIDYILPTITSIFNESLVSGVFPAIFKKAVVKPLLKKSSLDPNELKNYRPVSNLPFLSKILEKIVLSQLLSHLNHYKLLSPVQSAYRPHHSTETALLRMVNDILTALDQGKIATLALMDLSAAFDTIDHEILIQRLCNVFGLRDTVLSFIKSYLSNREQVVAVADCKSDPSYLKFGVPQGSVLGPILFIMYTQPLSNIISQSQINHVAFADDTQLYDYCCLPNVSSMLTKFEEGISHISSWMSANKLSLNPSKMVP